MWFDFLAIWVEGSFPKCTVLRFSHKVKRVETRKRGIKKAHPVVFAVKKNDAISEAQALEKSLVSAPENTRIDLSLRVF